MSKPSANSPKPRWRSLWRSLWQSLWRPVWQSRWRPRWRLSQGLRRWSRRATVFIALSALVALSITVVSEVWIRASADGHIFTEQTVPEAPVALVLGAQVDPGGTPSPFLAARLEIARRLLVAGKVKVILVSGDHMRAVTLCRRLGLDANGVGDDTMKQFRVPWLISSTREHGACVKAVFDVVSGRDPVYLGQHETGVDDALRGG